MTYHNFIQTILRDIGKTIFDIIAIDHPDADVRTADDFREAFVHRAREIKVEHTRTPVVLYFGGTRVVIYGDTSGKIKYKVFRDNLLDDSSETNTGAKDDTRPEHDKIYRVYVPSSGGDRYDFSFKVIVAKSHEEAAENTINYLADAGEIDDNAITVMVVLPRSDGRLGELRFVGLKRGVKYTAEEIKIN